MENERRAKYLLIDEQGLTKYGIEKGYYPDLNTELKNGEIKIADHDEAVALRNQNAIARYEDGGYYILNPYNQRYELASSEDLETKFVDKEMEAFRHILQMMGAKSIELEKIELTNSDNSYSGNGSFKWMKQGLDLSVDYEKCMKDRIFQEIAFYDPQNEVRDLSQIEYEMVRTGLRGDSYLSDCLNDLKATQKPLTQNVRMKFKCLNEVKKGLEIGAKLSVLKLKASVDYQQKSEETHEFFTTLKVCFGQASETARKALM